MSPQALAIVADLTRFKALFDFTRNDLANRVAETTAAGIFEYMDALTDPDNRPWLPLSPAYAGWKAKAAPGEPMAVLYRLMKDPEQLKGVLDVAPRRLVMTYGTDDAARDEACWFQEGDAGRNRPARPFYALNDLVLIHLAVLFDEEFAAAFGP